MKETSRKFLDKSEQSIAAAEHLLHDGYTEFAASRAYYATLLLPAHSVSAISCSQKASGR